MDGTAIPVSNPADAPALNKAAALALAPAETRKTSKSNAIDASGQPGSAA
jgi:hypothetical protein